MKEYAEVIVDISLEKLDRPFTYRIPEELREKAVPGSAVRIPFGKGGRVISGYIVGFPHTISIAPEKIRDIIDITAGEETAEENLIRLAAWMSSHYGSTMIQALKTVIPIRKQYSQEVERTVSIPDLERAREYLEECGRKHFHAKERALQVLITHGEMKLSELVKEADVTNAVIEGLRKKDVLEVVTENRYRQVVRNAETFPPDVLTDEQQSAVEAIRREWADGGRPVLLQGITGSGKTVVYTELIADALSRGEQVIVLIPEIALTWQTVLRFVRRFGKKVSFLHSRLSGGERYDQMKAAKNGDISIMVGPRSALFTPFSNLGLIIIDEEHEESYHSESVPRYHARETAMKRAELEHAHILFGSATPSITAQYKAACGEFMSIRLTGRFGGMALPKTEIVDLREEFKAGNRSIISRRLKEACDETLARGEQIILFLNRRGYIGSITCRECGEVMKCPHCDVSLTKHRNGMLVCHYCGYEIPEPKGCPKCGSKYLGGFSVGTEQVEEIVEKLYPGKRVLRMDADTTRGKEGHVKILESFAKGEADFLIGTQMIIKGHDFPKVTLTGVLLADLSLSESDYRAHERTFSMITQAVGRAGRGTSPGTAIIQTYDPENYAIIAAGKQDPDAFYKDEIAYRKVLSFPPVGGMTAILGSSEDEDLLSMGMQYIRKYIERIDPGGRLMTIGPAPQAIGKIKDQYRQVIYIRNADPEVLTAAVSRIMDYIAINSGFKEIKIQFDVI